MKKANKKLIKQAKHLIDSSLESYQPYYNGKIFIDRIKQYRDFLNAIIQNARTNARKRHSRLFKEIDFTTLFENCFRVIDFDNGEEHKVIDISKSYLNLEVINTIVIEKNNIFLSDDIAIRLLDDPENEVWLFEDELLELY